MKEPGVEGVNRTWSLPGLTLLHPHSALSLLVLCWSQSSACTSLVASVPEWHRDGDARTMLSSMWVSSRCCNSLIAQTPAEQHTLWTILQLPAQPGNTGSFKTWTRQGTSQGEQAWLSLVSNFSPAKGSERRVLYGSSFLLCKWEHSQLPKILQLIRAWELLTHFVIVISCSLFPMEHNHAAQSPVAARRWNEASRWERTEHLPKRSPTSWKHISASIFPLFPSSLFIPIFPLPLSGPSANVMWIANSPTGSSAILDMTCKRPQNILHSQEKSPPCQKFRACVRNQENLGNWIIRI